MTVSVGLVSASIVCKRSSLSVPEYFFWSIPPISGGSRQTKSAVSKNDTNWNRASTPTYYFSPSRIRPIFRCDSNLQLSNSDKTIPAWAAVMAFDTIVFLLTLFRACKSRKYFTICCRKPMTQSFEYQESSVGTICWRCSSETVCIACEQTPRRLIHRRHARVSILYRHAQ